MTRKKWYSLFVVTDDSSSQTASRGADATPPRRVADLVPEADPSLPAPDAPVSTTDLAVVYESARITPPAHGYTVLKVAEMLGSDHIRALPPDVKRKSILVALDAAGVKVEEVVQDALRRDRALDTYEQVLEKTLDGMRAQTAAENKRLEEEIARQLSDLRARVDANRQKVEQEERDFQAWRARKHQEEERIASAVSYFVSENPISTSGRIATDKGDADVR